MKLLTVFSSTLLFVLISQQFTSAWPVDEKMIDVTTDVPHVEHSEKEFVDLTTEMSLTETKRGRDEPIEEFEHVQFQQHVQQPVQSQVQLQFQQHVQKPFQQQVQEPFQQQIQETQAKRDFVDLTTEMSSTQTKREADEPVEESKTEQAQQQGQEPHTEETEEHPEEETSDKKKRGETEEHVKEEKPKKTEEGKVDEHVKEEKRVKEEKPKKVEEEKVEEHVKEEKRVKEEKPKKVEEEKSKKIEEEKVEEHVKEEKTKASDFCPENYVKFEDSCLFVGSKTKISARSGKNSISKTDSTSVENFPVGDDNSCPPGTEHTERGVCQKILTEAEIKAKKDARSCPRNAELVNGQCIFHSFDMMSSTMEMPLETSERPEIPNEEQIATATESKSMIESEFETTMQSVLKS